MAQQLARLAARGSLRVAGLMSGTSADGVSAAICDVGQRGVRVRAFRTYPYSDELRERIFRLFDPATARVDEICHLNFALGEVFAAALLRLARESRIRVGSIDLVGSHGQTIQHLPAGVKFCGKLVRSTLQIGEPSVIAERTGLPVVADFRPRDMAAGGQGAPLVPFADLVLFRDGRRSRAVQNIGGIANVTYLGVGPGARGRRSGARTPQPATRNPQLVLAFDTGPGNMIVDRLAVRTTDGAKAFDAGGRLAARGLVDARLLAELMCHPFLARRPPKSTGREEFGVGFADRLWKENRRRLRPEDLLATATAFTARSIAEAYARFLPGPVDEVVLCGGGARNRTLVRMLRAELPGRTRLVPPERFGVTAESREAVSFAILAWATVKGLAGNVPAATGASRAAVLGKIVPGNAE